MPTVLITGSNRGLGLEFARQYLADGWRVYASCRTPAQAGALQELAGDQLSVHALDVGQPETITALAQELDGVGIDVLVNNAGIFGDRGGFGQANLEAWEQAFRINSIGPYRVTLAFVDHVARGDRKVVAHLTSKMGSIEDNTSGGCYAYRSSKSALNMVNRSMSHDLRGRGITSIVLHPGWVATDMGGAGAPLQAPESVGGMRKVIAGLSPDDTGKFFNYDGSIVPW